jgi:hypothetical protein
MFAAVLLFSSLVAAAQTPQPFPQPGNRPAAPSQPARPTSLPPATTPAPLPPPSSGQQPSSPSPVALTPGSEAAPTEAMLGVTIYPNAQFITSYNAGRGQRYYLFGTTASFVELVNYYRTTLKQRGELVYEVPATHEFDVGKFNEDTMAFPPGVTIKDFQSDVSQGYPNPKPGGQPARFPTIIQIVPVVPSAR